MIPPVTTELQSGRQISLGDLSMLHTSNPRATAAMANPPVIVLTHPRDPGMFCGTSDIDVEDWLQMYRRVSSHNRWDATLMLVNVCLKQY